MTCVLQDPSDHAKFAEKKRAEVSPASSPYSAPEKSERNFRAHRFYERHGWRGVGPCEHAVEISGGRKLAINLLRYEKVLPCP